MQGFKANTGAIGVDQQSVTNVEKEKATLFLEKISEKDLRLFAY